MKPLLIASALIELGAGLGLLCAPLLVLSLLTGESVASAGTTMLIRLGGAGLFSLGIACWMSQMDKELRAAQSVVAAMLAYNIGAASVLGAGGVANGLTEPILWGAVALHTIMTIWCATQLAIRA